MATVYKARRFRVVYRKSGILQTVAVQGAYNMQVLKEKLQQENAQILRIQETA